MQKGEITSEIKAGVGIVEFYHPAGNSFPSSLLNDLIDRLRDMDVNPEASVIIVKSRGDRAFCAGASFDELLALEDPAAAKTFFMGFARLINTIKNLSKVVFGMVQGKAVGGGVGLAAAFDYCGAVKTASVKLSEINVGIGPFVIAPAVAHKVGLTGLQAMTYSPQEWFSADWAFNRGLYHELFESQEALEQGILTKATHLAGRSKNALKSFKNASWAGTEHWESLMEERAEQSGNLVLGEEAKAFLSTFKQNKA